MKFRHRILEAAVWCLTFPAAVLPLNAALLLGGLGGRLVYHLWPGRRRIAIDNIASAMRLGWIGRNRSPEELARANFSHMGRSVLEMLKIFHRRDKRLFERVRIEGREHLDKALEKGRGVLVVTGHCGNWELMAVGGATRVDLKMSVLARAQNNPLMDRLVERMRVRTGNRVIYKQGAVKGILTELRDNNGVGILIDQAVLVREGCVVSFLGRPALTTRLPAVIIRKKKTPVVPCFIHREADGSHIVAFHPEPAMSDHQDIETATVENMQRLTGYIERYVAEYPEQWLWGHRRWKRAPEEWPDDITRTHAMSRPFGV